MQWWASRRKHVGLKKLVVSSKEKKANYHHQSFYTASHFTSYIFSCVVYRCAFFVDELCCEGYHQIRHLYIREQHINNPHKILFCILYFDNYKQVPYKYTTTILSNVKISIVLEWILLIPTILLHRTFVVSRNTFQILLFYV